MIYINTEFKGLEITEMFSYSAGEWTPYFQRD